MKVKRLLTVLLAAIMSILPMAETLVCLAANGQ